MKNFLVDFRSNKFIWLDLLNIFLNESSLPGVKDIPLTFEASLGGNYSNPANSGGVPEGSGGSESNPGQPSGSGSGSNNPVDLTIPYTDQECKDYTLRVRDKIFNEWVKRPRNKEPLLNSSPYKEKLTQLDHIMIVRRIMEYNDSVLSSRLKYITLNNDSSSPEVVCRYKGPVSGRFMEALSYR